MRDILPDLIRWKTEGRSVALATVVRTWGSSPRRVGARMAITPDGRISGSVSGGCVEGAVFEEGVAALKSNRPKLLHFGVADETAWQAGLACGGSIDVFLKPLDMDFFQTACPVLLGEQTAVSVTIVRGPDELLGREMLVGEAGAVTGSLSGELDELALDLVKKTLSGGESRLTSLTEEVDVFVELILPPPTLIAVGGVHITIALMSLAKTLGYRTAVVDPRTAFGNAERFPNADRLIPLWPDEAFRQIQITPSTAVAILTHDLKLDDPALKIALNSPAFYVGALGSKSTNAKRRQRLLNDGVSEEQLARLHAPIGLDIGAQTPEEIALAILSEVVTAYRKRNQARVKEKKRSRFGLRSPAAGL